ncbi:MAG TPA: transcriptional regulator SplA domain-containing protein [Bacillus sp. (in: firmicutes)]|uniref:transcriptional regulator SplA domain-containing protein n=1 Tax=Bacillus litorisediminis TaxID=2922713 RepID=UPI001FAD7D04|nr:transcriptional regulator SplA domain-containing protein [Bacillus litorisediminis]HWO78282.1 transcriptional regulator SplA domain-containing protein [Bacillus sp. (in: firmicutes)]
METSLPEDYHPGQIVYVMYRNPQTQSVATIQEAAIVNDPYHPNQLALFIFDTFYPITNKLSIYRTREEAEEAYQDYFG